MENTTPAITLYSKPACVQCTMTKKALDKAGIAYSEVDLTQNPAALEYVTEDLNYAMAPVVVVDDENHWSGFRPDLIARAASAPRRHRLERPRPNPEEDPVAPYTKEQDQAWIEGRAAQPAPKASERSLHPQVHALQHALEQLRAARYWPQADPEVQDAVHAATAAIADELAHHTHPDEGGGEGAEPQTAAPAAGETVTVTGNLTAAPRLDHTPAGTPVANFTIASTPRTYDREAGEWKAGQTSFIRCTLWREAAQNAAASLAKGTRVIATGTLTARTYQAKDGQTRTSLELDVDELGASIRFAPVSAARPSARHDPARSQGPTHPRTQIPGRRDREVLNETGTMPGPDGRWWAQEYTASRPTGHRPHRSYRPYLKRGGACGNVGNGKHRY